MMTRVILVVLSVLVAGIILLGDRLEFDGGNTPRVVDAKYGIAAWPASPEFSIKSHPMVRTQYVRDWDGTGEVMRVSRTSRKGPLVQQTVFTYKRGEYRLRICDTRPAQLRFEVCGFVEFQLSSDVLNASPRDLGPISITTKDHAGYFLLAVRRGERMLHGTEPETIFEEFPGESVYSML